MARGIVHARQDIIARFSIACQRDERIRAAFIGGSVGSGTADEWADVDLYVAIADDAYDAVFADRDALVSKLGSTVFRETLHIGFDVVAFIMDSGVDGELVFHRVSGLDDLHTGPIIPVFDRAGLLEGRTFSLAYPGAADVAEELPIVLNWFWRDMLHFTRAIARERPWTAYAFLEKLRGGCQYLIVQAQAGHVERQDHFVPFDGYEALDHIAGSPELDLLRESLCGLDRYEMLRSARTLVRIYERLGPGLAKAHAIVYPARAAQVVTRRLDALDVT